METVEQSPFDRLVAGLEETRLELGLSRAVIAELGGLSEQMVYRLERGKCRNRRAAVKLRTALVIVELSQPPKDEPADVLDDLVSTLAFRPATLGGAA